LDRLKGRTALVTGAAGAIAGAISACFAAEGARVVCCDVDGEGAERTAATIREADGMAAARALDVSDEDACRAAAAYAVETFGALHVLVNAAATTDRGGDVVALDREAWDRTLAVNLTGVFLMSKHAIPAISGAGGGSIVNVASQLGSVAVPARPAYVTSKAAVIQLSRSMAIDFADRNIRVNSLSPGATETPRLLVSHGTMEHAREALVPRHPIGRLGQPDDIAGAALFLASDDSRFMTGADLVVDGGYTAV